MSLLYTILSGPAESAVSLEDCKLDLRVENNFEDALIQSYIDAASKLCSEIVGKKLVSETIRYSISCARDSIKLPFLPVLSVNEIQYFDAGNNSQTMSVDDFYLYNFDQHSELKIKTGVEWPDVYDRRDAINITFDAGFGSDSSSVPENIKRAIRLLVAHWYENRTASIIGTSVSELPFGVQMLLSTERVGWCA